MEDPKSGAPEESPEQEPEGSPAEGKQGSAKVSEDRATGIEEALVPSSITEALEPEDGGLESSEGSVLDLSCLGLHNLSPELLGPAERWRALWWLLLPYSQLPALPPEVGAMRDLPNPHLSSWVHY
ncbi:hypothetical protein NDU88_008177 [Pleurodeles waltl]|uniref:Uncharacterized protein n=1 Tax=Pleurodeles waltl TaxID=8319 RepID=A0AAV7PRC7_PLEWA|nr:hypothetical protein NDU88_008177 [Pleurodeles waltl]